MVVLAVLVGMVLAGWLIWTMTGRGWRKGSARNDEAVGQESSLSACASSSDSGSYVPPVLVKEGGNQVEERSLGKKLPQRKEKESKQARRRRRSNDSATSIAKPIAMNPEESRGSRKSRALRNAFEFLETQFSPQHRYSFPTLASPSWGILSFLDSQDIIELYSASSLFWRRLVNRLDRSSTRRSVISPCSVDDVLEKVICNLHAWLTERDDISGDQHKDQAAMRRLGNDSLRLCMRRGRPDYAARVLLRVKEQLKPCAFLQDAAHKISTLLVANGLVQEAKTLMVQCVAKCEYQPMFAPETCNESCYNLLVYNWLGDNGKSNNPLDDEEEGRSAICRQVQDLLDYFIAILVASPFGDTYFANPGIYVLSALLHAESTHKMRRVKAKMTDENTKQRKSSSNVNAVAVATTSAAASAHQNEKGGGSSSSSRKRNSDKKKLERLEIEPCLVSPRNRRNSSASVSSLGSDSDNWRSPSCHRSPKSNNARVNESKKGVGSEQGMKVKHHQAKQGKRRGGNSSPLVEQNVAAKSQQEKNYQEWQIGNTTSKQAQQKTHQGRSISTNSTQSHSPHRQGGQKPASPSLLTQSIPNQAKISPSWGDRPAPWTNSTGSKHQLRAEMKQYSPRLTATTTKAKLQSSSVGVINKPKNLALTPIQTGVSWGEFTPRRQQYQQASIPSTPLYKRGSPQNRMVKTSIPALSPATSVSSFSTASTDFFDQGDPWATTVRGLDMDGEVSETSVDLSFLN